MIFSLRVLKIEIFLVSFVNRKRYGIRVLFGKGLMKLRGFKSLSEFNLGNIVFS